MCHSQDVVATRLLDTVIVATWVGSEPRDRLSTIVVYVAGYRTERIENRRRLMKEAAT